MIGTMWYVGNDKKNFTIDDWHESALLGMAYVEEKFSVRPDRLITHPSSPALDSNYLNIKCYTARYVQAMHVYIIHPEGYDNKVA